MYCDLHTHSNYSDGTCSPAELVSQARELAREFDLFPSGGSDFHGANKPDVRLGSGKGDPAIPLEFYHRLREAHRAL